MILKHVSTVENCILFVSDILLIHSYDFYSVSLILLCICGGKISNRTVGDSSFHHSLSCLLRFYFRDVQNYKQLLVAFP